MINKKLVVIAIGIVAIAIVRAFLTFANNKAREEASYITINQISQNISLYEDHCLKINGTLSQSVFPVVENSFIEIMETTHAGKSSTLKPVWIPLTDRYNVYTLTQEDDSYIAMIHEGSLDQYLGKFITISGKVDGIKQTEDGWVDGYILVAETIDS